MRRGTVGIVLLALVISAPALSRAGSYDATCPNMTAAQAPGTGLPKQKVDYCQAADSARKGGTADSSLSKVWAAVAGVCTVACATPISGMGPVCTGVDAAGAVTDSTTSQNYMSSLSALSSLGAGKLGSLAGSQSGGKASSCVAAATSAMSAFTHSSSAGDAQGVYDGNLAKAAELNTPNRIAIDGSSPGGASAPGAALAGSAAAGEAPSCTSARNTGAGGAIVECAIASDPKLAGVNTPAFQQGFQKLTGKSLSDFVQHEDGVGPSIAGIAADALSPSDTMKVAEALKDMQDDLHGDGVKGTAYAGAGGGAKSAGGSDQDINGVMASVFEMFGKSGTKSADPKSGSLAFGKSAKHVAARGPATAEDRGVSLFERVTYRYTQVGPRLLDEATQVR